MDALYPSVRHSSRNLKYIVACADVVIDTTSTSTVMQQWVTTVHTATLVFIPIITHITKVISGNIALSGDGWSAVYCTFRNPVRSPLG